MKAITVYCASSVTIDRIYFDAARRLGEEIASRGAALVTGAGNMGLMGAVNDAAINTGGKTIGVIPEFMVERGWNHKNLDELIITSDMHERKEKMAALATGVIALPGGIGTFEELLEIITWKQLGLFKGNIVIYNTNGYYDNLLSMLDTAINEGFMKPDHKRLWTVVNDCQTAVDEALKDTETEYFSPKF